MGRTMDMVLLWVTSTYTGVHAGNIIPSDTPPPKPGVTKNALGRCFKDCMVTLNRRLEAA